MYGYNKSNAYASWGSAGPGEMPRVQRSFGFTGAHPSTAQRKLNFEGVNHASSGPSISHPGRHQQGAQTSFRFGAPAPYKTAPNRFRDAFKPLSSAARNKMMRQALGFDVLLAPFFIAGSAMTGAAQWGSQTGLEEDYVGGAAYGAVRETGALGLSSAGSLIGTVIGAPLGVPGAMAGAMIGGVGGYILGGIGFNKAATEIGMGVRATVASARMMDRLQFGGSFQDTQQAYTMRQRAIQEMSGSMLNARQYLGNEAAFLHER